MKVNSRKGIRKWTAVAALAPALLLAQPVLGEEPINEVQDHNLRQLLITNSCSGCDLQGVNLSGAHLIGADLREANLQGANLSWANLEGADLNKANLQGANLTGAFLTNASMTYANLEDVNFTQAHLYYVDITGATLENINLAEAQVIGTPISIGGTDPAFDDAIPVQVLPFEDVVPPQN